MEIHGVEVFSTGEWNGDKYTKEDLLEMVKAFNENSVGARPHLKLGHDDNQELLQRDGYPAAGWVERLYIKGEKLVADFSGIPEKIYKLIERQAYRKVSSEIFFNIKIGDKVYKRMLAAVALLGADNPGVMNLNDILSLYKKYQGKYDKKLSFESNVVLISSARAKPNTGEENMDKTENEIKLEFSLQQKEADLEATKTKLEETEKAQAQKDQEINELKEYRLKAEKEKAELLEAAEKAKVEKFTTELVSEKLCTPAMKTLVSELLGPEKKEYSLKEKDQVKKYSKEELVKEILKLFKAASDVNFEENSSAGDDGSKDLQTELHEKAEKYKDEHKVTYSQALKIVMRENQQS